MLLINGKRAPIPDADRVRDAIAFAPGMPNTTWQRGAWHGGGLHWTGAENAAARVVQTLRARNLSVHFVQEPDGEIVQTADLATRCAHIGIGNPFFWGTEVVCRGFATKADLEEARRRDPTLRERTELDWATPRDTYRDVIGGRRVGLAAFNPAQVERLIWLCETLAGLLATPRVIPWRRVVPSDATLRAVPFPNASAYLVQHDGAWWLPAFDRDARRLGRASTHRGVLGHLHLHDEKCDPGTAVFWALWVEGWNPSGLPLRGVRLGA